MGIEKIPIEKLDVLLCKLYDDYAAAKKNRQRCEVVYDKDEKKLYAIIQT